MRDAFDRIEESGLHDLRPLGELVAEAAKALPYVYGAPPGSEATKEAVRRAKVLLRQAGADVAAPGALRNAAKEHSVPVRQVAEAVLRMKGAE